jgi:hypothetical protein
MVPGETIELQIEDVVYVKTPQLSVTGVLYLTNYQIIFLPYVSTNFIARILIFFKEKTQVLEELPITPFWGSTPAVDIESDNNDIIIIPFASVARYEKVDRQFNGHFMFGGGENANALDIHSKDFRRPLRIAFDPTKHERKDICTLLSKYIFPQKLGDVFAVASKYIQKKIFSYVEFR